MGMSQHNSTNENSEERDVMTRYNWSVQKNPPIIRYYLLLSVIYRIYIDCMIYLLQKWIHSKSIKMCLCLCIAVHLQEHPNDRVCDQPWSWGCRQLRRQPNVYPLPPLYHCLTCFQVHLPHTHTRAQTQTQMGMYIRSSTVYIPNFPLHKMSFSC